MSNSAALKHDLELLEQSVLEAAELVMGYFGQDPEQWTKNGSSPVSVADLASDALLRKRLIGARPDYGWLSEETEDDPVRLDCDSVWVVDPIDGTNAFLQGKPDFTICAGLVRGGLAVAGVVINPVHEQTFVAVLDEGAWLNGERLSGPEAAPMNGARFLSRRNVMKPERWDGPVPAPKPGYVGSLAYQLCLLAMGERDAAVSVSKLHEWDIAAAGVILTEAGGVVTDQRGEVLQFNKSDPSVDGMICAAPELHANIRAHLIPKEF